MLDYLLAAFDGPGWAFMWCITALLAFGVAVFVERCWLLLVHWRHAPRRVDEALARDDLDDAVARAGRSPLADVLRAGAAAGSVEGAWDAMGAAAAEAEARIQQRIGYLATVGNVATMLGLLGTVYGLILAFSALGDTAAGDRAIQLSEGISTAMSTTAYGLIVGIPALLAHAWLSARATAALAALEASAGRLSARLRDR